MMTSVTSVIYGESKEIVVAFLAQYALGNSVITPP